MSGHAHIKIFEPEMSYSYTENSRKIVRHGFEYDNYWAKKKILLQSVLSYSESTIQDFIVQLKTNNIPAAPFDLKNSLTEKIMSEKQLVELKHKGQIEIVVEDHKGTTRIGLNLKETLDNKAAKKLFELCRKLSFNSLLEKWVLAKSPEIKPNYFSSGLIVKKYMPLYSLGIAINDTFRSSLKDHYNKFLESELSRIELLLDSEFPKIIKANKFWLEIKELISLKEKMGSAFNEQGSKTDLVNSVFNPSGPLFDDFGRRTIAQSGQLRVILLFVSKKPWVHNSPLDKNRAFFESWFHKLVVEGACEI